MPDPDPQPPQPRSISTARWLLLLTPSMLTLTTWVVMHQSFPFHGPAVFFFIELPIIFAPAGVLSIVLGFVFEQWRHKHDASCPCALVRGFMIFCINFLIFTVGLMAFSS